MCSAQQNLPRTALGVNPKTIVLYTAQQEQLPPRPSPLRYFEGQPVRPETICHSGSFWLPVAKRVVTFPSPPLLPCVLHRSQTMPLLISGPSPEIPVGTHNDFKGDHKNQSLAISKCEVPGDSCTHRHPVCDISTPQGDESKKTQEGLCPPSLLKLCYL